MKTLLILLVMIPSLVAAQLSVDSSTNMLQYKCNCSESIVIKGTPSVLKYKSKSTEYKLFEIKVDSTYYDVDPNLKHEKIVYLLSKSADQTKKIESANVFVLKRSYYADSTQPGKERAVMYYEIVDASTTNDSKINIIRRPNQITPCVHVQAIRPLKRNGKVAHDQKPDHTEKFIEKRKKKTRNS